MLGKQDVSRETKDNFGERLLRGFLSFFSDIKVYPYPMFVLYNPGSYLLKGKDIRKVISLVQPGDILLRKYRNYLSDPFIPGYFSHSGLYLGPVTEDDSIHVPFKWRQNSFRPGDQMVIHGLAEGVLIEDLINFCRCDYLAILRFPEQIKKVPGVRCLPIPDVEWLTDELNILKMIKDNKELSFQKEIFPTIFRIALKNLGRPYDFKFNFADFNCLSCTELIYLCTKCVGPFLNLSPVKKRVSLMFKKSMILPDAFLRTNLDIIWLSHTINQN